jgi:subtilisin family serine protease
MFRMTRGKRTGLRSGGLVAALAVGVVAALLPVTATRAISAGRTTYIVELAADPLTAYHGGIGAYSATSPRVTGHPLDVTSPEARRYEALLDTRQRRALRAAGAGDAPLLYRYRTVFPGFAARLTAAEVDRLRASSAVRAVTPDGFSHPLAAGKGGSKGSKGSKASSGDRSGEGPAFLGLPNGLWKRLGGTDKAGDGVIVGVLDTGIYPEHPSFADQPSDANGRRRYKGPAYQPPKVWRGVCQTGAEFPATACNNKLIGARYFVEGFGTDRLHAKEFLSPRDANGHGSHTASTAAGNYGVSPVIGGYDLGIPMISGVAPRAYVAMYKVCWTPKSEDTTRPVEESCSDADTVAAIDAAVSDGVNVINYSVGSSHPAVFGPVERSFLFAVDSGVFVAAAAGNDGPKPGTVGSPAGVPWVTSVAASTLGRTFEATVSVAPKKGGTGSTIKAKGASLTAPLPKKTLVDAAAVPAPGIAPDKSELCLAGSLDPAAVKGKAVLCKRGQNPRVEKGKVVLDAGGVGMVLYDATLEDQPVADLHWLPAAHVSLSDGQAIKALLAAGGPAVVQLGGGKPASRSGDVIASFSSRGPQLAVPDIAKPDLAAPGVDILAANTPTPAETQRPGETFQILSGTSMASPQVAGVGALLTQLAPTWSPAEMKSALMTSANPKVTKEDEKTPADVFEMGSGRIDPNRAADPGLVVDAGLVDYAGYLKGQDPAFVSGDVTPLAASDLNLPAVSFGSFTGSRSTVRTFTSVDSKTGSWQVKVDGLPGVKATVAPERFDIAPGQTQAVNFAFAGAGAAFDAYTLGAVVLTNTGDGRTVRLPVSIQPVKLAVAPGIDVVTADPSGAAPVTVEAGYQGDMSALAWGLAPPRVATGETIATAQPNAVPFEAGPGVKVVDLDAPPGAQVLAAQITNADGGAPDTDLDLYLFYDHDGNGFDAGDLAASSADADAAESIAVPLPPPGSYRLAVVGFKTKDPVTTYDFSTWLVTDPSPDDPSTPSSAPGLAATGDPKSVTPGGSATVQLEWTGVDADGVYLGLVTYYDSAAPDPRQPTTASLVRIVKAPPGTPAPAGVGPTPNTWTGPVGPGRNRDT